MTALAVEHGTAWALLQGHLDARRELRSHHLGGCTHDYQEHYDSDG